MARRQSLRSSTRWGFETQLVVVVILTLAACATDVANRYYGSVKYPAKQPQDVEILEH